MLSVPAEALPPKTIERLLTGSAPWSAQRQPESFCDHAANAHIVCVFQTSPPSDADNEQQSESRRDHINMQLESRLSWVALTKCRFSEMYLRRQTIITESC